MTPIDAHTEYELTKCLQYQILRTKTPKEIGAFQHQISLKTATHQEIITALNENPDAWFEDGFLLYFREWTEAELKAKLELNNKLRLLGIARLHERMAEGHKESQKTIRQTLLWMRERGVTIDDLVIPVEPIYMKR